MPPEYGVLDIFVTGRLCLFGEHSDWAGEYRMHNPEVLPGKTIIVGTQEGVHARAHRHDQQTLKITSTAHSGEVYGPIELPLEEEALLQEAQKGGFWSYVAGTAYRILVNHQVSGLVLDNFSTTLPMSKGLSSSAAICVMVARAFNLVYDLKLTTRGEMELAYLGEVTTPSKCGRMDQACAYGCVPVLMTFDADILHVQRLSLGSSLHLVLVDLRASKDTTTILHSLQAAYPHPEGEQQQRLTQLLGEVREGQGVLVKDLQPEGEQQQRLMQLQGEVNHAIIDRALKTLAEGDLPALGSLMREAQAEFDSRAGPLCPEQLTAPRLHLVLELPEIQSLIWGGKGVGSQGDGTAQLLCRGAAEQLRVCQVLEAELGMSCMPLTVHAATEGAGKGGE